MTTYIDKEGATSSSAPYPLFSAFAEPMAQAVPAMLALWAAPLTMMQIWSDAWQSTGLSCDPAIDQKHDGVQLPVPDPIQQDRDAKVFA